MRIAVTGAGGIVGSAVAERAVAAGHSVVGLDRTPLGTSHREAFERFFQAETSDYDALLSAFHGCDAVIHLAAITTPLHDADHRVHNNNVVGSYNVMRAAAELGITRVCQASSVNAIGHAFSRRPRYDYFPIDEDHPTYCEDPYSLSKWICEQQADSIARRFERMRIASLRMHMVVRDSAVARERFTLESTSPLSHLFAYTRLDAAAEACLLSLVAEFDGHQVFNVVAPCTTVETESREVASRFFPDIPIRGDLKGRASFFSSAKAERILNWRHASD